MQKEISAEVKKLLQLKADYKKATGQEWKPPQGGGAKNQKAESKSQEVGSKNKQGDTGAAGGSNMADSKEAVELKAKIDAQGTKVRDLKAAKAPKVRHRKFSCKA